MLLVGAGVVIALAFFVFNQLGIFGGGGGGTSVSQRIDPQTYTSSFQQPEREHILVDVRTPGEFASGYIPGAINIPVEQLSSRLSELPQDAEIVLYCRSGNRSASAARTLSQAGYSDIYDLGGIIAWQRANLPITR